MIMSAWRPWPWTGVKENLTGSEREREVGRQFLYSHPLCALTHRHNHLPPSRLGSRQKQKTEGEEEEEEKKEKNHLRSAWRTWLPACYFLEVFFLNIFFLPLVLLIYFLYPSCVSYLYECVLVVADKDTDWWRAAVAAAGPVVLGNGCVGTNGKSSHWAPPYFFEASVIKSLVFVCVSFWLIFSLFFLLCVVVVSILDISYFGKELLDTTSCVKDSLGCSVYVNTPSALSTLEYLFNFTTFGRLLCGLHSTVRPIVKGDFA